MGQKYRASLLAGVLFLPVHVTHAEVAANQAAVLPSPCTEREAKAAPAATPAGPSSPAGSPPVTAAAPCMDFPPEKTGPENMLRTISVSAARAERDTKNVPGTLTVISADTIKEQMATSIKDLIRYEPGISVGNNPSRFGMSGFNIRGVDGNRILIQMDGIRQPDNFVIGGFANTGRTGPQWHLSANKEDS